MKKYTYKFIVRVLYLLVFISVFSSGLFCANEDARYNLIRYEYILNEDGSTVLNYTHQLKYLSYFSINRALGETFIVYNPDWQKLTIKKATTTMKDGKKVDPLPNAFNEVLPGCASRNVPYFNLREMVITHVGLERGSTVDLQYSIETKADFLPGLNGLISVGGRCPIDKLEIIVTIPSSETLYYNKAYTPEITNNSKKKTYSWIINKIALVPDELNQPAMEKLLDYVSFTTMKTEEVEKYIFQDKSIFFQDDDIKKVIEKVNDETPSQLEKALALNEFVHSRINYCSCELETIGFKPRSASKTLRKASGSSLDRAILLKTLLDGSGIKNEIDFIVERKDPLVENILCYKKPIVIFEIDGLNYYLDPNSSQNTICIEGLYGKNTMRNLENQKNFTPSDKIYQKINGDITESQVINSKMYLKLGGRNIPSFKNDEINETIKSWYQALNYDSISIKDNYKTNMQSNVDRNIVMTNKSCGKITDKIWYFTLPYPKNSLINIGLTVNPEKRDTPLEIGKNIDEEYEFEYSLPDNIKFSQNSKTIDVSNDAGKLKSKIEVKSGKLIVYRKIFIENSTIEAKDYKSYRELMVHWFDKDFVDIYFLIE